MVIEHIAGQKTGTTPSLGEAQVTEARSRRVWTSLRRSRVSLISAAYLVVIAALAVLAPVITHVDPNQQDLLNRLDPPSAQHWLGTDEAGRDEYTRLVYGARISLFIAICGTIGGLILGTLLGLVSGFFGGWVDNLAMRFVDILYAFPGILLAILIVAFAGPSIWNLIFALTVFGTPTLSRLVRAVVLTFKSQDFIEAARVAGATRTRIMFVHLLPNSLAPIIVYASLAAAGALLATAGLGFLGVGVQPPTAEWGSMLSTGQQYIREAQYLVIIPGVLIFLTVLAFNLIGDALRDALDPRTR